MDELNTVHIPLLVSQICTRWRKTALATPRLWSRLFITLDGLDHSAPPSPTTRRALRAGSEDSEDGDAHSDTASTPSPPPSSDSEGSPAPRSAQLELVSSWLSRSGVCPLTVYLFWEEPPFGSAHPVLDALMEHSERWEVMFFYLPYAAFKYSLSRVRNRLPLLRELSLGTSDEPPDGYYGKLDVFSKAPELKSLECVNCSPLTFKFPWKQLEKIPMMSVTVDDCIDVLLQTTNLEKGGFIFMDSVGGRVYGGQQQRVTRHQHDSIKSFTIMTPPFNETVDLRGLFPQLSFPRLEELLICNLRSPFCNEFVTFLTRLRCLRTLHLRKTALTDHQLVQGLKFLPILTSLIVYSAPTQAPTVTHHLLEKLSWSKEQKLLPLLKKLELTIDYNVSEDFIAMVLSRVLVEDEEEGPARLEYIRIRPTEDLGDEIYTGLAKIASHGVEVCVEDLD